MHRALTQLEVWREDRVNGQLRSNLHGDGHEAHTGSVSPGGLGGAHTGSVSPGARLHGEDSVLFRLVAQHPPADPFLLNQSPGRGLAPPQLARTVLDSLLSDAGLGCGPGPGLVFGAPWVLLIYGGVETRSGTLRDIRFRCEKV